MAKIIWVKEYELGLDFIDKQHRRLSELFNNINDAMENGKGVQAYASAVEEMIEYAEIHFREEEEYMEKIKFPGIKAHKDLHQEFRIKTQEFKDYERRVSDSFSTVKIVNFLWDWFLGHILEQDRKYLSSEK